MPRIGLRPARAVGSPPSNRRSHARLALKNVNGNTERFHEMSNVIRVRCDDADSVEASSTRCDHRHRRINDVTRPRIRAQHSSGACQRTVKWNLVAVSKRSNQKNLSSPVAPRLSNHARRDFDEVPLIGCNPKQCPGFAMVAVKRDQSACVEDKRCHRARRRRAAESSASLNAPCCDSHSAITSLSPRAASWRRAASANHAETLVASAPAATRTASARSDSRDTVNRSTGTGEIILLHTLLCKGTGSSKRSTSLPLDPTTRYRPSAGRARHCDNRRLSARLAPDIVLPVKSTARLAIGRVIQCA